MATREHVFVVVLDGNPGALRINNAKVPAIVGGKARLIDSGPSSKAKRAAVKVVEAAALAQPDAAKAVGSAATLVVEVDTYWARQRSLPGASGLALGDVDGPLKLTIDTLEKAGVIDDDVRVVEVRARKFLDRERPRIEMRVMPAGADRV